MKKRALLIVFLTLLIVFSSSLPSFSQWVGVKKSTPRIGQKDVPLDQEIIVEFSHPINPSTYSTKLLMEMPSKTPVPSKVTLSDDSKTLYIKPLAPLKRGTFYWVMLTTVETTTNRTLSSRGTIIDFTTVGGVFNCLAFANPAEVTLVPGNSKDIEYNFVESGGGVCGILRSTLVFEDLNGNELARSNENIKIDIPNNTTTRYPSAISISKALGESLIGQKIKVVRIFEGLDNDSRNIMLKTSVIASIERNAPDSPGFDASVKFKLAAPDYGALIPRGSNISASAGVEGFFDADCHGCWILDGNPVGFFVQKSVNNLASISTFDKRFAEKSGVHRLQLQITSPRNATSEEIAYVVCDNPLDEPILLAPGFDTVFKRMVSTSPVFRWSVVYGAVGYEIAISPTQDFKDAKWIKTDTNAYKPDWIKWGQYTEGTYYWKARPVFPGQKVGSPSAASRFNVVNV